MGKAQQEGTVAASKAAPRHADMRTHAKVMALGVLAAAIIIAIMLLYFNGPLLGLSGSPFQWGSNTGSIGSLLSSPQNQTFARAMAIVWHGINSTSALNASYKGIITITVESAVSGRVQYTMPVEASYQRYLNNTRVTLNMSGMLFYGSVDIVSISLANGTAYSCNGYAPSGYSGGTNTSQGAQSGAVFTCQVLNTRNESPLGSLQFGAITSAFNETRIAVGKDTMLSGHSCTPVRMSGSLNAGALGSGQYVLPSSATGAVYNYSISMCLSDQYYLPVGISGMLRYGTASSSSNPATNITFSLNATSLSSSITKNAVVEIPKTLSGIPYTGGVSGGNPYGSNTITIKVFPAGAFQQVPTGPVARFNVSDSNAIEVYNESRFITGSNMTVTGWFMPVDAASQSNMFYFGFRNDNNADFYVSEPFNEANYMEMRFRGSTGTGFTIDEAINSSVWNNVALVYDGSNLTAYVNGIETGSIPAYGSIMDPSQPFYMGLYDNHASAFNGYMSNVQLYDRALSGSEIRAIYTQGINGASPASLRRNLVGWWPLNGTVNDYSVNGNNGQKDLGQPLPSFVSGAP